jgi:hypothetical protein
MVLSSFGVILLGLAITTTIIELLAYKFGETHPAGFLLMIVGFVGGAVLFGAGQVMGRRRD